MTVAEILTKVQAGKLDAAEAQTLIGQLSQTSGGRTIKLNSKGGLFFRDPNVKAYSTEKQKDYVYSLNMPMKAAQAIFGKDSQYRDAICEFVQSQG